MSNKKISIFEKFKDDIPASIVVFLVAMPLCLGIAMASGAPLFSGIISGIIGGIVVGALSGSPLGVSGPAAGLAIIVLNAISDLGSFEVFLVAIVIAGILQILMGYLKAGILAYFFPSSVIHGMLAGIGIIIFLKQIPHAFGYDSDPEGDFGFEQVDGHNTFDEITQIFEQINLGVTVIALISLIILIIWNTKLFQNLKFTKFLPGPLVAVIVGIVLNIFFKSIPSLSIEPSHLVMVSVAENLEGFLSNFQFPDFKNALTNPNVYITGVIIAIVASIETLLCVEATDKLDPLKRITPTNRELKAQGIGNILSGLIGGLPVTQVIVRSSANIQSGGQTKLSSIFHGIWLAISIILFPQILNMIPLGVLAAILMVVGYKLAKPSLFRKMYKEGWEQFLPFIVTIFGLLFTNLLAGIGLGLIVAIISIIINNYKSTFNYHHENINGTKTIKITLSENVTFLNKAHLLKKLKHIEDGTEVIIDGSHAKNIHFDVKEIINDFVINSKIRNIKVKLINL